MMLVRSIVSLMGGVFVCVCASEVQYGGGKGQTGRGIESIFSQIGDRAAEA